MVGASRGCEGAGARASQQEGAPAAPRDSLFGPRSAAPGGQAAGRQDAASKVRQGPEVTGAPAAASLPSDPALRGARRGVAICTRGRGAEEQGKQLRFARRPLFFSRVLVRALILTPSHPFLPVPLAPSDAWVLLGPQNPAFLCFFVISPRSSPLGLAVAALTVWGPAARPGPTVSCPLTVSALCLLIHLSFRIF